MPVIEFAAYGDESGISDSRYRAIAVLTGQARVLSNMREVLVARLADSDVSEFKWKKFKNAKYKFAAQKLLSAVLPFATRREIRVDTLIWDTYDSRHAVVGRDSNANFERMYYHLLHASLKRWPRGAHWSIHPDEKNGVDWDTLSNTLTATGRHVDVAQTLWGPLLSDRHFAVDKLVPCDSTDEPLVQVADLFAGMAVYSTAAYHKIKGWRRSRSPTLFDTDSTAKAFSNGDRLRCAFIDDFDRQCKNSKLGVSLRSQQRLRTMNPKYPLNFWHYEPQGDYDKAPVRNPDLRT